MRVMSPSPVRFTPQMYSSDALRPESQGLSSVSRMVMWSTSPSRSTVTEFGSATVGLGVAEAVWEEEGVSAAAVVEAAVSAALAVVSALVSSASTGYEPRPAASATEATTAATPRTERRARELAVRAAGFKMFRIIVFLNPLSYRDCSSFLLRRARTNPTRISRPPRPAAHRTFAPV